MAIDNRLNAGRCGEEASAAAPCGGVEQLVFERVPALLPLMVYSAAVAGG